MPKDAMFHEYGASNEKPSDFCPDGAICEEWIEERAIWAIENFREISAIYMSNDVYVDFVKLIESKRRFSSNINNPPPSSVASIQMHTVAGSLEIKRVPLLVNFCHVGTETSFQQLEWLKVSQEFENIVLKD